MLAVSHLTAHYKKGRTYAAGRGFYRFPCSCVGLMKTLWLLYKENVADKLIYGTRKSVSLIHMTQFHAQNRIKRTPHSRRVGVNITLPENSLFKLEIL